MQFIDYIERKGTNTSGARPISTDCSSGMELICALMNPVESRLHVLAEQEHGCVFVLDRGVARGCYVGNISMLHTIPQVTMDHVVQINCAFVNQTIMSQSVGPTGRHIDCVVWDATSEELVISFNHMW